MMNRIVIILLVLLGLTSCYNDTAYKTDYVIQPYEQLESGGDRTPLAGVKAYAFEGNTEEWYIASYEDAQAGVITSKIKGEQRGPIAWSEPREGSDTEISLLLESDEVVIVVVDPATQVYGYTGYVVPQNFNEVLVTLLFYPWKDASYTASTWNFVVPERPEPEVDPDVSEGEPVVE